MAGKTTWTHVSQTQHWSQSTNTWAAETGTWGSKKTQWSLDYSVCWSDVRGTWNTISIFNFSWGAV